MGNITARIRAKRNDAGKGVETHKERHLGVGHCSWVANALNLFSEGLFKLRFSTFTWGKAGKIPPPAANSQSPRWGFGDVKAPTVVKIHKHKYRVVCAGVTGNLWGGDKRCWCHSEERSCQALYPWICSEPTNIIDSAANGTEEICVVSL